MVICLERDTGCLRMVQLMPLSSPSFLASFISRLVLPFLYRLTQVVLEKRPLNGCSSSSCSSSWIIFSKSAQGPIEPFHQKKVKMSVLAKRNCLAL